MTRLEKCQYLEKNGYTCDSKTGKVYGIRGKEIISKDRYGYYQIKHVSLYCHHFIWYMTHKNVEFKELDHINRDKGDNRIDNLRISTRHENSQNKNHKGYSFNTKKNKWRPRIMLNGKEIYLGFYNTEEEARQAYLQAKSKYHLSYS